MARVAATPRSGNPWVDGILGDTRWAGTATTGGVVGSPVGGSAGLPIVTVIDVYVAGRSGDERVRHGDGTITAARPSAAEAAAIDAAMAAVERVCAVDLRAVGSQREADVVWASVSDADAGGNLGWADLPGGSSTTAGAPQSRVVVNREAYGDPDALAPGGYDFCTFVHELGHALGLDHPHDDGDGAAMMPGVSDAFDDLGDWDANQGVFTMMTYNDGWRMAPHGPTPGPGYGHEVGPMAIDVAALQHVYGARADRQGDDAYGLPGANRAGTGYACLWDAGGADRMVGTGRGDVIDLRAATLEAGPGVGGFVSHARGVHGGFTIANGVTIEDAAGGGGDDHVQGNDAANRLWGSSGDDRLWGWGGHDRLEGGGGADALRAGPGDDRLTGGTGRDWLKGGAGRDDFVFRAADDGRGTGRDVVVDFARTLDDLDLAAIDARADARGDQAFVLDAGGSFARGEVRQRRSGDDLVVEMNLDGDGDAEVSLLLQGLGGRLGAEDFIL